VANKLGDPTAKKLGRITINPIKHIDPVGTIAVPLFLAMISPFVMGWAKPVPVEPRYFKSPLLDMALVAVAGPVSNFFMACFWAMFIQLAVASLEPSQTLVFLAEMGKKRYHHQYCADGAESIADSTAGWRPRDGGYFAAKTGFAVYAAGKIRHDHYFTITCQRNTQ